MKTSHARKHDGPFPRISSTWVTLAMIFLIAVGPITVGLIAAGCTDNAAEKRAATAKHQAAVLPVMVAEAVEKDMPIELQAVGTVEAYATVTVRAQVEGQVTAVHLKEGQCVTSGDPLFTIDSQLFDVQLKQAQANLARDKAQLENAQTLLERNASVVAKGYVSKEQYDQAAANAAALAATVQADEAAVEDTRIQLAYCSIRSPLTGCAGEVYVDRGNVVKANDADHPLVVIRQIRPIYVGFYVPERYLPEVRKYSAAGKLIVLAAPTAHDNQAVRGELAFVDNSVNAATGTILLKAVFANTDRALWPGQFVNITLQLTSQPRAVVVPSQAVQTGQQGQYVFVVKSDHTVEYRPVSVERTVGEEAVIAQGIQPRDQVVTDGQLRLSSGAPVKIVEDLQGRAQP
jgi:membrane fusion protein, multidrug efflux system